MRKRPSVESFAIIFAGQAEESNHRQRAVGGTRERDRERGKERAARKRLVHPQDKPLPVEGNTFLFRWTLHRSKGELCSAFVSSLGGITLGGDQGQLRPGSTFDLFQCPRTDFLSSRQRSVRQGMGFFCLEDGLGRLAERPKRFNRRRRARRRTLPLRGKTAAPLAPLGARNEVDPISLFAPSLRLGPRILLERDPSLPGERSFSGIKAGGAHPREGRGERYSGILLSCQRKKPELKAKSAFSVDSSHPQWLQKLTFSVFCLLLQFLSVSREPWCNCAIPSKGL